jgi:hypothetical protein
VIGVLHIWHWAERRPQRRSPRKDLLLPELPNPVMITNLLREPITGSQAIGARFAL